MHSPGRAGSPPPLPAPSGERWAQYIRNQVLGGLVLTEVKHKHPAHAARSEGDGNEQQGGAESPHGPSMYGQNRRFPLSCLHLIGSLVELIARPSSRAGERPRLGEEASIRLRTQIPAGGVQ